MSWIPLLLLVWGSALWYSPSAARPDANERGWAYDRDVWREQQRQGRRLQATGLTPPTLPWNGLDGTGSNQFTAWYRGSALSATTSLSLWPSVAPSTCVSSSSCPFSPFLPAYADNGTYVNGQNFNQPPSVVTDGTGLGFRVVRFNASKQSGTRAGQNLRVDLNLNATAQWSLFFTVRVRGPFIYNVFTGISNYFYAGLLGSRYDILASGSSSTRITGVMPDVTTAQNRWLIYEVVRNASGGGEFSATAR